MTTAITFPQPDMTDIVLEARQLLGDGLSEDDLRETKRVSFGACDPIRLSADSPGIESDLAAYLIANKEYRFVAAGFTCSFRPGDDPITECRLAIRLRRNQPDGPSPDPVVWSVDPEILFKPIKRTIQNALNAQAKYILSAGASRTATSEYTIDDCYLISTGKGESIAEWFFRHTAAVPKLEGMHDIRLVARCPAGVSAIADVRMSAKVQRRAARLVPYRAILPPQLGEIPLE